MVAVLVPQIALASWWNPFSWSVFHRKVAAPVVQQIPASTTTITVQKNNTEAEISSLKKEIEELKAKDIQPKPATSVAKTVVKNTPPPALKVIEPPKTKPVIVSSASTNPASQCLSTKKEWDTFVQGLKNIGFISLVDSYFDLAFGTDNRPTDTNARFAYNYTRLVNGESKFYVQAAQVSSAISSLPFLPYGTDDDLNIIKKGYMDALHHLENSYDFSLEAFKTFGDNPYNYISKSSVDTSYALYKDAGDEYDFISPSLKIAYGKLDQLQTDMQNGKVLGCNFTFKSDRTVITTIESENLFTQQIPKSNANNDDSTTISITTKLPVEINENGQTKRVLKLLCNPSSQPEILLVGRLNENSVGAVTEQTNSRHQCVFVYTGNGSSIYTKMIDFNF